MGSYDVSTERDKIGGNILACSIRVDWRAASRQPTSRLERVKHAVLTRRRQSAVMSNI
jgi:hypothetical protein